MIEIFRSAFRTVGLLCPQSVGGARDSASLSLGVVEHGRSNSAAANCTGFDGRPLASILTPGEAEASVRPGDHRFVGR